MKGTRQLRRLLQAPVDEDVMQTTLSPEPVSKLMNGSSEATSMRRQFGPPTSPLDSSMALTILVLLTAIFFMGFFSIYIRRFGQEESDDTRRRRHPSQRSSSSSGLCGKGKGLEPTTIQALPLVSYGRDAKQLITDCPICLTEFEEKEIVKLIPHCKHMFHPECLDTWLSSHVSCPLCRSTQLLKKVDDDVHLDVQEVYSNYGRIELQERYTADNGGTWSEGPPVGVRRACSCRNLEEHIVLQRSMSF